MAFIFSSMSGTSGITTITLTADPSVDMFNKQSGFTLSNANRSLYMGVAQKQYVPTPTYDLSFSPSTISFDTNGGSGSISVTSNDSWVIRCSDWISIDGLHEAVGSGNTTLLFTVSASNESYRFGTISGYCTSDTASTASTMVAQFANDTIIYRTNSSQPPSIIRTGEVTGATFVESGFTGDMGWIRYSQTPTEIGGLFWTGSADTPETTITYIGLPNGIETLGSIGGGLTALEQINIPNSVTELKARAFTKCGVRDLDLNNVTTLNGTWIFAQMTNLTEIKIPDIVTNYPNSTFDESTSLERITIGSGATSLGTYLISLCESLTDLYVYAPTAPSIVAGEHQTGSSDRGTFAQAPQNLTVHYPQGADYSVWMADAMAIYKNFTFVGDL